MKKFIATFITLLAIVFSSSSFACNKVAQGYEDKDTMYVVCGNLSGLSSDKASKLVRSIMSQYTGPPDEIIVYFVASSDLVGKAENAMSETELVGYYYTHSPELVIWPSSKTLKKVVGLTW